MDKVFKLAAEEIQNLAVGYGVCIATDRITVDGEKVGFMYRDEPSNPLSGWVFMSGSESQDYMDDAANLAMYDINTIANYDADIIPFIESPVGTEVERDLNGILKVLS
jgi:hypothetical protein